MHLSSDYRIQWSWRKKQVKEEVHGRKKEIWKLKVKEIRFIIVEGKELPGLIQICAVMPTSMDCTVEKWAVAVENLTKVTERVLEKVKIAITETASSNKTKSNPAVYIIFDKQISCYMSGYLVTNSELWCKAVRGREIPTYIMPFQWTDWF